MLEVKPSPSGASRHLPINGEEQLPNRVRVLSMVVEDGQNTLTKIAGAIRRRGFH